MKGLGTIISDSSKFWSKSFETITSCKTDIQDDEYIDIKHDVREDYDTRSTLPRSEFSDKRKYIKNDEDEISNADSFGKVSLINKKWTTEEDNMLISFVNNNRKRDWKKIGSVLNKTSSQCSYRYSKIKHHVKLSKWSRKDDLALLELVELYGENWAYIQTKIPEKKIEDIKLHYTSTLDPILYKRNSSQLSDNVNNSNIIVDDIQMTPHTHKLSIDFDTYTPNKNFDDEYYSIFVNKRKDSYDINLSDHFLISNQNEDLLKQYNSLENVFRQVYEYSNEYNTSNPNSMIDKCLENRRHLLSNKLNNLKQDYTSIANNNVNNSDLLKKSIINQIEVVIELINTIKMKIVMMQDGSIDN